MMPADRLRRAALYLMRRLMPPARADWCDAIEAEFHHLPDSQRTSLALECFAVALCERAIAMKPFNIAVFAATLFVTALLALLGAANAIRLFTSDPSVAVALAGSTLIWTGAFTATVMHRHDMVRLLAAGGAAYYAAVGAAALARLPAFASSPHFLTGLAIEGMVLMAALFACTCYPALRGGSTARG